MQKVLIIALSGIGDALMFTPAIKLFKETYPNYQIDALVMFKGVKDIYERNENISKVYYHNFLEEGYLKSLLFVFKLRKQYNISVNVYPSNRREYNLISFLIGAKKRAAVNYLRENLRNFGFLNNVTIEENDSLHNVEENVNLISKLTGREVKEIPQLEFPLLQKDVGFADKYLMENRITEDDLVIGFHPGCATLKNHIRRRWEPEKFTELGKKLIAEYNAKIFIFGGPEENELKNEVASGIKNKNAFVINSGSLAESTALMKRCNLFVTNDSSLMHIASALNLKVIAIIGPTNPSYIHPWKTEHKIVSLYLDCAPCFYYSPHPLTCYRNDLKFKCIKNLDVNMVYGAVKEFIPMQSSKSHRL